MTSKAMSGLCNNNCTDPGEMMYDFSMDELWEHWNALTHYFDYQPWIFSVIGSAMVGLSGVLPLLVIPIDEGTDLKNGAGAGTLKILLSFAVGGLLGDVFLHLLPEAWASKALNIANANGQRPMTCGLWVLSGFLLFIIAEKMFIGTGDGEQQEEDEDESTKFTDEISCKEFINNNCPKELENNNCLTLTGGTSGADYTKNPLTDEKSSLNEGQNGFALKPADHRNGSTNLEKNGYVKQSFLYNDLQKSAGEHENLNGKNQLKIRNGFANVASSLENRNFQKIEHSRKHLSSNGTLSSNATAKPKGKRISGYLNLMANCIDNFTHGLAVGGSFLVSFRLGALTTFAILIHEIPHEVGDFAILLKSGFNRWDAARAQLMTASGGIFGALVAVVCSGSGIESRTSWILPFTAGGFLHIGLVTVLPDLLKETNPKESIKQLGALLSGIIVMAILTTLCD